MSFLLNGDRLIMGTCYYPEHWPEKMWEEDLDRMLDTGIEVIRIAEFAWSKVEPEEGKFTYDFWDRFLDICDRKGMKVIFCTPTATPPAWLTHKYPETLNADINGNLYRHGSRRHYNYNSPVYREKSRIITEAFASHYGKRGCIIGWQLDNELNCEIGVFYSEADKTAFRKWCMEKYKTLDALNEAWGTVFWNQTYSDWEEVSVPGKTVNGVNNQHQMLDFYRFISDSCRSFAHEQAELIRKYIKPGDFITTNGMFGHLDNHAFARESLDFYMYDSYPNFANRITKTSWDGIEDRWWSKNLARTRSVSGKFGIMEQQSGANGWTVWDGVPSPRPGQISLWTMQSIAHGADYISYFRWRTATVGTEIYWHGILDYSGRENERLREVKNIKAIMDKMSCIAGKRYEAKVAVIEDYDNSFDAEYDKWHGVIERASSDNIFRALQTSHTPFDYVNFYEGGISEKLDRYELVFWPHPVIATKAQADMLTQYVNNGGILVIGARAGYKDVNGHCVMDRLPGVFSELTGADVKEYSFIQPDIKELNVEIGDEKVQALLFADRLSEDCDGEIIGRYDRDYFAGDGALLKKKSGKGTVYYYASAFSEEAAKWFLKETGKSEPYADIVKLPAGCEIAVRGKYMFVLNYSSNAAKAEFLKPVTNVLSGRGIEGTVIIPAYGFVIAEI